MHLSFPISIIYLLLLLILIVHECPIGLSVEDSKSARCIKREALALLDFKQSFSSILLPNSKLLSWSILEEDCCVWNGIACDNQTGHVVSLDLSYEYLTGNQLRHSLLELQHLRSLNLSWNDFSMRIPEFIGSLSKLTYLDLSYSGFFGQIPFHLGNLSSLQTLVLSQNSDLYSDSFRWLSRLSSLEKLDMSYANFSDARDWLSTVAMLPLLSFFYCSSCSLPPPVFPPINSSTSLQTLDLSYNILSTSMTSWLMNNTRNLLELHLSYMNNFQGPFPNLFKEMDSLRILELPGNHLEQGTWESIGKLCSLKELYASECGLQQSLTDILETMNCASSSLETLHLSSNNILIGTLPRTMKFPMLTLLDLSSNQLDRFSPQDSRLLPNLKSLNVSFNKLISLPEILHHLPTSLEGLYLSSNSFNDVISGAQVLKFSKLRRLDLSNNPNLTLNFSKAPFQLEYIGLRSCKLGPDFPSWLLSQKRFSWLDISNSMISGSIPIMFWKNLPPFLRYFNLSLNSFHDTVPNLQFPFAFHSALIDLSSNAFYGPIPFFLFTSHQLLLLNNNFSSFAAFPYASNSSTFLHKVDPDPISTFLDLSNNLLSGPFPDWFWNFRWNAISVANNNLSGTIPSSIGLLSQTHFLSLRNNSFSGELPFSLKNCTWLRLLDLSENELSGSVPPWIGENLVDLVVLSLRSNHFSNNLSSTLCYLSFLEILDLSHNKFSGDIPSCVYNFTAMAHNGNISSPQVLKFFKAHPLIWPRMESFFSYALFNWKGKDRTFHKNLPMVKFIDLSSNDLTGEIPMGFASLVELKSLNLSCNKLNGKIPVKIGLLKSLESLNLAWNRLCGPIPASLAEIASLAELDVSHNNLSGRIPISTQLQGFDPSSYAGNPELCGLPLPIKCPGDGEAPVEQPSVRDGSEKENKWDMQSFYAALGTGFAFGFLTVFGTLNFKSGWSHALFQFA